MSTVIKGDTFKFTKLLKDGRTDKFLQLHLFDSSMTQIAVHPIPHLTGGIYSKNDIVANTVGHFFAKYIVYRDNLFTKVDKRYFQELFEIRVDSTIEELTEVIDVADGRTV